MASKDNLLSMSMGEMIFIGVIILLVVPPEKLPGLAREIARFFNDIRRTTSGVWDELKKDTPNPMEEFRKQKQDVEDYMKLIGSDINHSKDNPHFVKTESDAQPKPAVENQPQAAAETAAPVEATTQITDQKNEPDKK